jgi:hypothetical protein
VLGFPFDLTSIFGQKVPFLIPAKYTPSSRDPNAPPASDNALIPLGDSENVAGVLILSVAGRDVTQANTTEQRSRCNSSKSEAKSNQP